MIQIDMDMPEYCGVNECPLCTLGWRDKNRYTEWCHRPNGGFVMVGYHSEENIIPDDCPLKEVKRGDMSDPISRDKAVAAVLATSMEYQLIYGKKEPKEGFVRSLIKSIANIPQEETERKHGEWIPVSEKYPTPWELVWVTDKRGRVNVCQMSHKDNQYWYDGEERWMYEHDAVVAWMPYYVPEPYKEAEE